jgi:putative ABC transport system permease protein
VSLPSRRGGLARRLGPSLRALAAHKARTALVLGSVAVGVAAVLLTSAVGKGAEQEVMRGIESLGPNLVIVRPAPVKKTAARKAIRGLVTTLRVEDYEAVRELADTAEAAPGAEQALRVKGGNGSTVGRVLGTGPAFVTLRRMRIRAGRFFDGEDDQAARRVAVLGDRIATTLFGPGDPVGDTVRIRGVPFEVIGVLSSRGVQADGSDEDNLVLVPIRTALRRVFNTRRLTTVFVGLRDSDGMDEAERAIRARLRERHRLRDGKPDDFAVQNQARLVAMQQRTVESLTLLTSGLAAVSLVVAGIGILGLMLVSVKERTAEIGLRMAVGARPRDILVQFLAEAALLATGGWLVGAALAAAGAAVTALATEWKVGAPLAAVAASFITTTATGLVFGAFPARKAARMPAVVALGAR